MKRKYCSACHADTLHIVAVGQYAGKRDDRCVQCARPFRSGNVNPKNLVTKRLWDGKIMFGTTTP
jgi:hypothetical protein